MMVSNWLIVPDARSSYLSQTGIQCASLFCFPFIISCFLKTSLVHNPKSETIILNPLMFSNRKKNTFYIFSYKEMESRDIHIHRETQLHVDIFI